MLLTYFGVEFEEVGISLFTPGFEKELKKYSPTQKVPVLLDSGEEIWDSLAICEYLSEQYLENRGWPSNVLERASCRAVCSEMHSGFPGIRTDLPMNCRAKRQLEIGEKTMKEVKRIDELWSLALLASGGPYLYGEFGIADCMFAPVVSRFSTYQLSLSPSARLYSETMLKNPAFLAWVDSAKMDTQIIDICEVGQELAE
jgi:glutathione S-transferase